MNFQQIRFVQAIVDTGSFTKAAERCFVTQPTLSNAISQLETELGGEIFHRRSKKPPKLTEFGHLLMNDMQRILSARENLMHKAADYVARDEKCVRLGLSPLISDEYVSTLLTRLKSVDDEFEVIISQMNKADIEPALLNGSIDYGLGPKPMGFRHSKSIPIYSEPLLFLSQESTSTSSVALDEISGRIILFVQDDCGLAGVTRSLFDDHAIEISEYEGRALSYNVLENWVKLGLGSALLPASKVTDIGAASRIDNDEGFVSVEFQASWLAAQEQRRCFNMMQAGLSFAS